MGGQSALLNPPKGSKLKRYTDYIERQNRDLPSDVSKAIDVLDYIFDKPPVFRTPHWLYRDLLLRSEIDVLFGNDQTDKIYSDPKCLFLLDEITAGRLALALELAKRNAADMRWKPKRSVPSAVLVVCAALFEAFLAQGQVQPYNRVYEAVARRLGLTREVVRGVAKKYVLKSDVHNLTLAGAIQAARMMAEADRKQPHGFATLPSALCFQAYENSDGNTQIGRRIYSRAIWEIEKCQTTLKH